MTRRGVRAPLLLRPRRAGRARRAARLAARRVHRRGALHAPLRAVLPAAARARRRRARGAADVPLPARGPVRLRRAAAARAPEPRARPPGLRRRRRPRPPCASRCATPTTRPSCRAASASSRARSRSSARCEFRYWSIARDEERERTLNPYALLPENGTWYVIGEDQDDKRRKNFRVSRIRADIRFATRRERDFRMPADFDVEEYRGRPPWQFGDVVGEARIEVAGDTAWWVERSYGRRRTRRGRRLRHRVRRIAAARALGPAPGRPRDPARARRRCGGEVATALRARARRATRAGADPRPRRSRARVDAAHVARAPARAGRAGALRRPPVAARLPAGRLRRGRARP